MNGLLKVLAKHKALTLITCLVLLLGAPPLILGTMGIIWLMKILTDFEGKKK